ncbi:hypothetical protein BDZ89DRAFT_1057610, partial [Hymenopellis radicata]
MAEQVCTFVLCRSFLVLTTTLSENTIKLTKQKRPRVCIRIIEILGRNETRHLHV